MELGSNNLDVTQLLTRKFAGEILAMLIKEHDYENLKDKDFEIVKSNSIQGYYCIKIGDKVFENKNSRHINVLWDLYVPNFINTDDFINEVQYIFNTNLQIVEQANWENEDIKFLGNYRSRGGIQKDNIKIILNFIDLYNIYVDDKLVYEDIYADELLYCLVDLKNK